MQGRKGKKLFCGGIVRGRLRGRGSGRLERRKKQSRPERQQERAIEWRGNPQGIGADGTQGWRMDGEKRSNGRCVKRADGSSGRLEWRKEQSRPGRHGGTGEGARTNGAGTRRNLGRRGGEERREIRKKTAEKEDGSLLYLKMPHNNYVSRAGVVRHLLSSYSAFTIITAGVSSRKTALRLLLRFLSSYCPQDPCLRR